MMRLLVLIERRSSILFIKASHPKIDLEKSEKRRARRTIPEAYVMHSTIFFFLNTTTVEQCNQDPLYTQKLHIPVFGLSLFGPDYNIPSVILSRETIVNRTYGTHKNLHISLFFQTIFGPIYYGPP